MIRTLLTFIFLFFYFIICLIMHLIYLLLRGLKSKKADTFIMRWVQLGFKGVMFCAGTKVTVKGLENLPKDQPAVLMANHRSIFDIVTTYACLPSPTGILAKQELRKIPILNLMMLDIHCLFLDRSNIEKGLETILTATEYVKSGFNYLIFPEGTRSKEEGNFLPFHAGSFKIAFKSGAPVVPVTIVNTGDIFEPHFPSLKAQKVIIEFGTPIDIKSVKPAERKLIPDKTRDIIMETYERNKVFL